MKRILVVDDDIDIVESLSVALEHTYQVATAFDGAEALRKLDAESFDALVLDLMMPVLDGETLMKELHARRLRVPVRVMSAFVDVDRRAERAGAADWRSKPFRLEELELKLARLLAVEGQGGGQASGDTDPSPPASSPD